MAFNTGNALGSKDVKDLFDNAENIDIAANSAVDETWTDRLGTTRRTLLGIENDANSIIATLNNEVTGAGASAGAAQAAATAAQGYRDQASEIAGLGTVADAVGVINLPQPDVYIPFNDGVRIESGYGTFDQVDVSAAQDGSIMVNLPSRSADFSRASGSAVINKSGELVSVGVDEPTISRDGLQVFGSVTNLFTDSELIGSGNGTTSSPNSTTAPDGTSTADLLTEDTSGSEHASAGRSISLTSGVTYTLSVYVKPNVGDHQAALALLNNNGGSVRFNLATKTAEGATGSVVAGSELVTTLPDSWLRISASFAATTTASTLVRFEIRDENGADIYTGDGISGFYLWGAQLETGVLVSPYVKTGAGTATRSPDIVSIPVKNNFPVLSKPFTVVADAAIPVGGGADRTLFRIGVGGNNAVFLRRNTSDSIFAYQNDSSGNVQSATVAGVDGSVHRFIYRFDGQTVTVFVDGVSVLSFACIGSDYLINSNLYIGSLNGTSMFLGSEIKYFNIFHDTLSDEQIAALGGPQ